MSRDVIQKNYYFYFWHFYNILDNDSKFLEEKDIAFKRLEPIFDSFYQPVISSKYFELISRYMIILKLNMRWDLNNYFKIKYDDIIVFDTIYDFFK